MGGAGSGFYGHAGRPGLLGGSSPSGSGSVRAFILTLRNISQQEAEDLADALDARIAELDAKKQQADTEAQAATDAAQVAQQEAADARQALEEAQSQLEAAQAAQDDAQAAAQALADDIDRDIAMIDTLEAEAAGQPLTPDQQQRLDDARAQQADDEAAAQRIQALEAEADQQLQDAEGLVERTGRAWDELSAEEQDAEVAEAQAARAAANLRWEQERENTQRAVLQDKIDDLAQE